MAVDAEVANTIALTLWQQQPILQVLIPLCTAPLIVFLGSQRAVWWLCLLASMITLALSASLLFATYNGDVISYHIGGWPPPFGIEYRIDSANGLVAFLISAMAVITLPYAYVSVGDEIARRDHILFYACYMLCFTGLLGMVVTADAFNVFVFLEISSLSSYVLIALGARRDKRALTAAYDYLIMGTIGATFFVIGIGFIYMVTGTLNMADLADRIADQKGNRTVRAGFAFIIVGMGLKMAVYPLHLWLPRAYSFAPSAVTVFLSATATKAAIFVLLRFMFSVFQLEFILDLRIITIGLGILAIFAMFSASFIAIFQVNFKRMLAYSSIAQIGYMVLGIALLNAPGLTATMVHMVNHGITKALMFMGVGALMLRVGSSFYDDIKGIGRQMPFTAATVVIGGFSLIGVPGTVGFISKWALMQAAFDKGLWWLAILIVLSSLLAVIYVWRAIEVLYLQPPKGTLSVKEAPLPMLLSMWILALACIWFGINTDITFGTARFAGALLLDGSTGMAH